MACDRDHPTTIRQARLAPFEQSVLDIVRCYCQSYSQPGSMAWEVAFDTAGERFGAQGPHVAQAAMAMLRALRVTRRSAFQFINPFCPSCSKRITVHEMKLMRLLCAVRSGDAATTRTEAMILTEGGPESGLVDATRHLVELETRQGIQSAHAC